MWFLAPVKGINSAFGRILVRGHHLRKVQLAWFVAPDKKRGAAVCTKEMHLSDEIGYVSLERVGSICNSHYGVMPMSKLWL